MDIVLTGTEEWAIDQVRRSLLHAGHDVRSCYDVDAGSACNAGTRCGVCPATEPVDVIVAVRAHPLPNLTRREQATACPMLAGVPLVVAGSTVLNPFGSRANRLVEGLDGVEEACLAAAMSSSAH
jgi:hypothetical protein